MRITAGLSTFQHELALQGLDYEEVFEQQEFEITRRRQLGLSDPDWAVTAPSDTREPDNTRGKNNDELD